VTRIAARVSLAAFLVLAVAATTGVLASNSLPATKLGQAGAAISANALKPADCGSLDLSNVTVGSGTFAGTADDDLILGASGADDIVGGDGDDCVVGGAGADTITGGAGNDVCIGSGNATFASCETEITR
jgi:Ca2+-binding RTX toxin-like protein